MNSVSVRTDQTGILPMSILAVKAKNDKSLLQELWDRVYRYVRFVCSRVWTIPGVKARCEIDDLIQESYFGFCKAVEKYDPERGGFITFLTFYIRKSIADATRGRTSRLRNDPIFTATSLDIPIGENETSTIAELIPDDKIAATFASIEESDSVSFILEQIDKIQNEFDKYIFLEYAYKGRTSADIARELLISDTSVHNHVDKVAKQLRNSPAIRAAYPEQYEKFQNQISLYARKSVNQFRTSGLSIVETIVLRNNK